MNRPRPQPPVIVKKVISEDHSVHHGGAWKVAYADFVTAMMAFFLLLWLMGSTSENQRRGIADYFSPTMLQKKENSAGTDGVLSGERIEGVGASPGHPTGAIELPYVREQDRQRLSALRTVIDARVKSDRQLRRLARNIRMVDTREGLRIDLVDEADFSMFVSGTDVMTPQARQLLVMLAEVVRALPNPLLIRGHTDAAPFVARSAMSNWMLSAVRAEATRQLLQRGGVAPARFARIEGVADREPYVAGNRLDPRNRRMSLVLGWGNEGSGERELAR